MSKVLKLLLSNPNMFYRKLLNKFPKKLRNFLLKFPSEMELSEQLSKLRKRYEGKPIFVFPSPSTPWGYMFQRPQQLATALSKKGFPVIYCVDTSFVEKPDWDIRGLLNLEGNIYLYNDGFDGQSLSLLKDNVVIWQYWPHQQRFIERFVDTVPVIYDCIDHLTTFSHYNGIEDDHQNVLLRATLVLATADNIMKSVKPIRDDCILVPNGVHYEDFSVVPAEQKWDEMEQIRKNSKVIIGYYGAIAEWMDFELIEYCASQNPDWTIVLIGEVYPDINVVEKPNIIYLPRQDYKRLSLFLNDVDVAVLPFKINDITINTSPVKIFEYMASGTPVVSTALHEVLKYNEILIGNDKYEFNKQIKVAMGKVNDHDFISSLRKCAQNNTWDQRVETVLEVCKERGIL